MHVRLHWPLTFLMALVLSFATGPTTTATHTSSPTPRTTTSSGGPLPPEQPATGPGSEQTLYELLDRLVTHHALTALICSHELELVYRYAHQVLCLNRRLQCVGPPAAVLTAEALAQLYGPAATLYRHRPPGAAR